MEFTFIPEGRDLQAKRMYLFMRWLFRKERDYFNMQNTLRVFYGT